MNHRITAEIITIGTELLNGTSRDGNGPWLSACLTEAGFTVQRQSSVRDEAEALKALLQEALDRSQVTLVTGGLGPTHDDITKKVLQEIFGGTTKRHPHILQHIEKLFEKRNRTIREVHRQQADLPEACEPVFNEIGTAPGMWFKKNNNVLIAMPGVPYEMQHMVNHEVLPALITKFQPSPAFARIIHTAGTTESELAESIRSWEDALPRHALELAYLPSPGQVKLQLKGQGAEAKVRQNINEQVQQLEQKIPELIFGFDQDTLESVIGNLLRDKQQTLATAESCTGGSLAGRITSISGSSDYFIGSIVAYQNAVKTRELEVPEDMLEKHGAVSEATVKAMATGVRQKLSTDYGIAVSGIAGPSGGTTDKPVGTVWIALATPETMHTKVLSLGSDQRLLNIERSVIASMNLLRLSLQGFI